MTFFIVGAYQYQNGRTPCAYPDTYAKGTPVPNRNIALWRRKLQAAYAHASDAEAKRALLRLGRELTIVNASAARSLEEGLEETLTLHRLSVFPELGTSFKTTNPIESVMARVLSLKF